MSSSNTSFVDNLLATQGPSAYLTIRKYNTVKQESPESEYFRSLMSEKRLAEVLVENFCRLYVTRKYDESYNELEYILHNDCSEYSVYELTLIISYLCAFSERTARGLYCRVKAIMIFGDLLDIHNDYSRIDYCACRFYEFAFMKIYTITSHRFSNIDRLYLLRTQYNFGSSIIFGDLLGQGVTDDMIDTVLSHYSRIDFHQILMDYWWSQEATTSPPDLMDRFCSFAEAHYPHLLKKCQEVRDYRENNEL